MTTQKLDVIGIGNAIVDVLSQTNDDFITKHDLPKGNMILIETEQAEKLYSDMGPAIEMSGGSAANTIAGFASLGGKAGYIGKVSADQLGAVFAHDIKASGVEYKTKPLKEGDPTARCLIFVTPDAERTMCTFLGASVKIEASDLDKEMIESAKITYLEGYLFDRDQAKEAFKMAAEIAHKAGKKVALTLSDPFCVNRHRAEFVELVENHIDILFANEQEIMALYETDDFDEAVSHVLGHCEVAALTLGAKGSVILTKTERHEISAAPVDKVVDTTGAGDLYAAGFLYGYSQNMHLADCGRIASMAAAEIISHMGARPQEDLSKLMTEMLSLDVAKI